VTNQVRIFVSSTFADFERERRLLHEQIRPTLDEMARHFGLALELSDFRWGVTSADLAQDRTAALCLHEVDLCRRLSPEANFLVLLGDRAGSRIVPGAVPRDALERLCADLRKASDSAAAAVLRTLERLFTADAESSTLMQRDLSEAGVGIASSFAVDLPAARCLIGLERVDPSAEELRRALAFSITHREILKSRLLLDEDGNPGAAALIRSRSKVEEAQSAMRRRVEAALGQRAARLQAPASDTGSAQSDYEALFVQRCTELLGDLLRAARSRGTRSHYFSKLRRTEPQAPRDVPRHPDVLDHVERWMAAGPASPMALIGPPGSGRSDALEEAAARIKAVLPEAQVIHLSLGAQPDLENIATFAATLMAAATPEGDDEAGPDTTGRRSDLIARAERVLRSAERARPLFLLIDDLDRLDGGQGLSSAAWLWSGATSRRLLFTSGDDIAFEPPIDVIALPPLSLDELRRCAEDNIRTAGAADLDPDEVIRFVTSRRPGAVQVFVRIAAEASSVQRERWGARGPTGLVEACLEDLFRRAPFSRRICDLFLGSCLIPEVGVNDTEFLSICQGASNIRTELQDHFPQSRFLNTVPSLVWHRLTAHFSIMLETRFRAGGQAWCVRDEFAAAVTSAIGQAAVLAVEKLLDLFLQDFDRNWRRGVDVLPRLLSHVGRHSELAKLALAPEFMAKVVVADRTDALLLAIGRAPSPSDILAEIMAGVEGVTGLSPQARSHWLLDLSVLGRELGFASDAATLALLAFEIRKEALGLDDALCISAVLEATDVLLEAQRSEEAERLSSEVLAAVGQLRDSAVTRLRLNRCSALFNVGRGADAEELVRALLPELATDEVANAELIGAYNLLGVCCLKRGSVDEAQAFAARAVEGSIRLVGLRTRETAVIMLNLAMIQLRRGQPDAAVATLAEVLSIYSGMLDPGHPWVENAEHAYFGALSEAGRIPEAVAFVVSRLERVREFERAAPWMFVAAKTLAAAARQCEGEGLRTLYLHIDDLVTSSSEEAWTGELAGRFIRRVGASLGIEDHDGKGLLIAAIYVWVLVVVASVRAAVVSEAEARQHFATLELRVGQLMGVPAPPLLDGRVGQAWRFFTHQDWPAEAALLRKLALAPRDAGLIDAFKALAGRASSVAALRADAETAKTESGGDSDAAGQALILVAARAAAAGDFDTAIPAQTEAVAIAGRLFGLDSMQRSTAILNLGALQFRAKRFSEAFDAYSEGLERLFLDGASVDRLGGPLQNAFKAGIEAERFVEAGQFMTLLANRSGASPAKINFGAMASSALLRADMPRDAVVAFESALSVVGAMETREAADWIETVIDMASMFVGRLKTPEAMALTEALRLLESRAEVAGWGQALRERPAWAKLLSDLEVS